MDSIEIVIQEHKAKRAGLHYDIRLVHPSYPEKVYSFVTRRKDLFPMVANQKFFWPMTQVHNTKSAKFEGAIEEGYGAGEVQIIKRIPCKTDFYTELTGNMGRPPEKFHIEIPKEGRYTLVKRDWGGSEGYLIIKTTEQNGIHDPIVKNPIYKSMDPQSPQAIKLFQSPNVGFMDKKDGAGVRVLVDNGKLIIASERKSVTGETIIENSKVRHLDSVSIKTPEKFEGYILRGELYSDKVPASDSFKVTSRVLLSAPDRANKIQEEKGKLKLGLFGVLGRKDAVTGKVTPVVMGNYQDQNSWLTDFAKDTGSPEVEAVALTTDYKEKLSTFAKAGEGVIAVFPELPLGKTNPFIKLKKRKDINLEIIGFTEGEGARKGKVGALILTDRSRKANIMVGSGFGDSLASDMYKNFHKYKGRVVKVQYFPGYKDGLRGPVFLGFEEPGVLPDYKYEE